MTSREFFDANRENREYCKLLQAIPEAQQIQWENESASLHSPGIVANGEELARRVEDPTHFDALTGTIRPSFFDDASNKGASCFRLLHTTVAELEKGARAHVETVNKNPPNTGLRSAIGYATLSADEVRQIFPMTEPGRRGAGVFDTGKADDVSHADICQLVAGKQAGRSVRAQLYKIAKDRLVAFAEPASQAVAQSVAAEIMAPGDTPQQL